MFCLNTVIILHCGYLCVYIKAHLSMYCAKFFKISRIVMSLGQADRSPIPFKYNSEVRKIIKVSHIHC